MSRNYQKQPTADCRKTGVPLHHRSVVRFLVPSLTALLLSLPFPALGWRSDLLWFQDFQAYSSPIDSSYSWVYPWQIRRDNGSLIAPGEGVVAEHAFLGRNWDREVGYIGISTFSPLDSPWTVESVSFDWYVPNLDSATRLTVEWNDHLEPYSPPGDLRWRHLFSAEYEPGSGVHREVIDFTVSTARNPHLSFRFIPSQGNGETGFAVQDLGRGFSIVGATPEASAPTRVVAAGLILWTLRRSRARNRPSAAREAVTP